MAKHRTPQELLVEAMERVKELQVKALSHSLANHPSMQALIKQEKEAKKNLAQSAKWLDPEKGLKVRIERLEAQLKESQEKLENAEIYQEAYHEKLMEIQQEKKELSESLIAELDEGSVSA